MASTLLSCIDSKMINSTKFYGRFELGTFSSGQGLTVANALRRALLSELYGTAIILVQISNAAHEYDSLPGVRECVLDLLLNLKQIILTSEFKIFSPQIGFLHVKGPGVIRARDLKLPFFIYCSDPDQYIGTVTKSGQLNLKFLIHCGKTYLNHNPSSKSYEKLVTFLKATQPQLSSDIILQRKNIYQIWQSERNLDDNSKLKKQDERLTIIDSENNKQSDSFTKKKDQKTKLGYFPIDAIFSPVQKVNYTIEQKYNFEKEEIIILELWTNGSIDPRNAIHQTVKSLIQLFVPLQKKKLNVFTTSRLSNNNPYLFKPILQEDSILNNSILSLSESVKLQTRLNKLKSNQPLSSLNLTQTFKKIRKFDNLFDFTKTTKISVQKKEKKNFVPSTNSRQPDQTQKKALLVFKQKIFGLDLINLNLTPKVYFSLKKEQIITIGDLVARPKKKLLMINNFTSNDLRSLEIAVKAYFKKIKIIF